MSYIINIKNKKVALGLSGGVDSAVSAYLLKKAGYEVFGFYLQCFKEPGCRAEKDRQDALKTALEIGIQIKVLDFRKEYRERVWKNFLDEYKRGRTPNPDVLCNSEIKFGIFYDYCMDNGYDFVATGHYSRIITNDELLITNENSKLKSQKLEEEKDKNILGLFTAKDLKKDQSYFLYRLKQEQLKHILFPVGGLLKSEVREIARKARLSVANKKDSMGICFVGDISVRKFLEEKYGKKKGNVALKDGTFIGEHDGYWFFNVGKRGEFRIQNSEFRNQNEEETQNPKPKTQNQNLKLKIEKRREEKKERKLDFSNLPKLYVVEIKKETNEIVVGEREDCERREFKIDQIHFLNSKFKTQNSKLQLKTEKLKERNIFVKIRNTGKWLEVKLEECGEDKIRVKLVKKVFGVSSGQSCVVYRKVVGCRLKVIGNDKTQNSKLETQNYNLKLKTEKKREENKEDEIYELVGGGVIE